MTFSDLDRCVRFNKWFENSLFKDFNIFPEALDYARNILGRNCYISPFYDKILNKIS